MPFLCHLSTSHKPLLQLPSASQVSYSKSVSIPQFFHTSVVSLRLHILFPDRRHCHLFYTQLSMQLYQVRENLIQIYHLMSGFAIHGIYCFSKFKHCNSPCIFLKLNPLPKLPCGESMNLHSLLYLPKEIHFTKSGLTIDLLNKCLWRYTVLENYLFLFRNSYYKTQSNIILLHRATSNVQQSKPCY